MHDSWELNNNLHIPELIKAYQMKIIGRQIKSSQKKLRSTHYQADWATLTNNHQSVDKKMIINHDQLAIMQRCNVHSSKGYIVTSEVSKDMSDTQDSLTLLTNITTANKHKKTTKGGPIAINSYSIITSNTSILTSTPLAVTNPLPVIPGETRRQFME